MADLLDLVIRLDDDVKALVAEGLDLMLEVILAMVDLADALVGCFCLVLALVCVHDVRVHILICLLELLLVGLVLGARLQRPVREDPLRRNGLVAQRRRDHVLQQVHIVRLRALNVYTRILLTLTTVNIKVMHVVRKSLDADGL